MAVISHPFIGGMDLDSPDYVVPAGWHRQARNLIPRGNKGNQRLESQLGTTVIPNSYLPLSGNNKCIGNFFDAVNQRFFWFNYNSAGNNGIYIYNTVSGIIQRLIQSGFSTDGDILNFTADMYITSVDIIYGETYNSTLDTGGDLLFFVDSLLRPTKINIQRYLASIYGTIERSYIDVAKAPPVMPIKCTYENDNTTKVNNLLNSLFQFCYSFIYDDGEESVISSGSIVPLPTIVYSPLNNTPATSNSIIALYVETGDVTVKSIRIYGRQTQNGKAGSWFIVNTLQKSYFSISSNTVYRYTFKNDGNYITADPKFTVLLQDYVPQQANCQALLDGSTVAYSGILEGYNYVNSSFAITDSGAYTAPYYTINGVLFFAYQPKGTNNITIYLTGVGTNDGTTNLPTTLDNPPLGLNVRAKVGITNYNFSYTNSTDTNIANILSGLQTAAVSAGYTYVSSTGNSLTISLSNVVLQSAYFSLCNTTPANTQQFAHYPFSGYSYGVVYYDSKGRTNGVITDATANINTPNGAYYLNDNGLILVNIDLSGFTPPSWATYYHLVRTDTLTYNKYLWWITNGAYSNIGQYVQNQYAYLEIDNIQLYNQQIQSTSNVVSYEFTQGDRVKIVGVYNVAGTFTPYTYDYAILGTVQNPVLNGIQKTGTFLQINYPTSDIGSTFKFDGTPNFQNYQILIYSIQEHQPTTATTDSNVYYEIGQQYGIGNAGTVSAYHIGNVADNQISLTDGDVFLRTRNIPIGASYYLPAGNYQFGNQFTTFLVNFNQSGNDTTTSNYVVGHQSNTEVVGNNTPAINNPSSSYPVQSNGGLFQNISSSPISIRIRGEYTLSLQASAGATTSGMYVKLINASGTYQILQIVVEQKILQINTNYDFAFDATITVPAGYNAFIIASNLTQAPDFSGLPNLIIGQFTLRLDVLNSVSVPIYDASFSDSYSLYTNSDSRPLVQDRTSLQQYFSTLFRYSEPYVLGTNINNTNRFYPENFDEFDKSFGDTQRMIVNGRQLKIFQNRKCGVTTIYGKFIKNQAGQTTLITTDEIITRNNVQYYDGDYGIGTQRTGVCHNGYQFYLFDPIKGYLVRESLNGLDPISEEFKVQTWAGSKLTEYNGTYNYPTGGTSKLIAVYNFLEDRDSEVLFVTQGGTNGSSTLASETLSFIERTNVFPTFYDFGADHYLCAENTLYSWNNGLLYVHNNNTTYCNYYGTQFKPSVTVIFNDFNEFKKSWQNVQVNSNITVNCPTIYTQLYSYGSTPQQSSLIDNDFKLLEGEYQAAFLRDANSQKGLLNGDFLKGTYISITFTVTLGSIFLYLINPSVKFIQSQLNEK